MKIKAADVSTLIDNTKDSYFILHHQLEELLALDCDGIFAGSDSSAITISTLLALRGIRIPVIGCNNSPVRRYLARECVPATISLKVRSIGCQAAQRLLQRIDGKNFPPEQFIFEPEILDNNNFTGE